MIRSVHNECYPLSNGTEIADYQPVTDKLIEMCDMLLKLVGSIDIIIICIITDNNSWILNYILYEAQTWNCRIRKSLVFIRNLSIFILHILMSNTIIALKSNSNYYNSMTASRRNDRCSF